MSNVISLAEFKKNKESDSKQHTTKKDSSYSFDEIIENHIKCHKKLKEDRLKANKAIVESLNKKPRSPRIR